LVEVVDLKSDRLISKLLIKTNKGSFAIKNCAFDGDWLAVTTKDDRVITYSLASGKEIGHVFGHWPTFSAQSNLLVVPLSETIMNVYELSTTEFRSRLKFAAPVIYKRFTPDGKQLFVMTSDQTVYVFDLWNSPAIASATH
jgi:WD40 repeat protein